MTSTALQRIKEIQEKDSFKDWEEAFEEKEFFLKAFNVMAAIALANQQGNGLNVYEVFEEQMSKVPREGI